MEQAVVVVSMKVGKNESSWEDSLKSGEALFGGLLTSTVNLD